MTNRRKKAGNHLLVAVNLQERSVNVCWFRRTACSWLLITKERFTLNSIAYEEQICEICECDPFDNHILVKSALHGFPCHLQKQCWDISGNDAPYTSYVTGPSTCRNYIRLCVQGFLNRVLLPCNASCLFLSFYFLCQRRLQSGVSHP